MAQTLANWAPRVRALQSNESPVGRDSLLRERVGNAAHIFRIVSDLWPRHSVFGLRQLAVTAETSHL